MESNIKNPFYNNYLFSFEDTKRGKIGKLSKMWLWILPTYVQVQGGVAYYYKQVGSRIYLMQYSIVPNLNEVVKYERKKVHKL